MPVAPELEADPAIVGPLGGLLLSFVRAGSPMLALRAVRWWRDLARLGVHLPLFAVHDLGLLYAAPRERVEMGARPGSEAAAQRLPGLAPLVASYRTLIAEVAEGHAASTARGMRLGDDLVVVVLARLLSTIAKDAAVRSPWPTTLPLDLELVRDLDAQLPSLFAAAPRSYEQRFLAAFARSHLRVLTLADATDLDTLRLLGMVGGDAATAGVHAAHGYGGVGREGSVDSMVLTELAWEDEELARRMLDGELLFYSREQAPKESRRLHHIVVDASASMRGEREIFARGLAIALGKKLQLGGEDVWMRFFDSRLYDVQRPRGRASLPAAWLLGCKGESGRNPARVFAQLATEMALLRERDARDPVIHLITHAALHVPRPLVQEVRRQAHLFAVFILPSGGTLDLEWLDLLEGYAIVDHAALQQKGTRAAAAAKIVDDASTTP